MSVNVILAVISRTGTDSDGFDTHAGPVHEIVHYSGLLQSDGATVDRLLHMREMT